MRIAVIGTGPVGIEMAAAAVAKGFFVSLFERSSTVAGNMTSWGHVKLFSPNELNVSVNGLALLRQEGRDIPEPSAFYTGAEFVSSYLEPLASILQKSGRCDIHLNTAVTSVARGTLSKGKAIGDGTRKRHLFDLLTEIQASSEEEREVRYQGYEAVVDASGTYSNSCWMGRGGIPAVGERKLQQQGKIHYVLPNLQCKAAADQFAAADADSLPVTTAVVGAGASAITTIAALKELAIQEKRRVQVAWFTRKQVDELPYSVLPDDPLPQRKALYQLGNDLSKRQSSDTINSEEDKDRFFELEYVPEAHISKIASKKNEEDRHFFELEFEQAQQQRCKTVDNIIAHCGFRPDTSMTSELQVHYCYATEGPMKLAAAMMAAAGGGGAGANADCLKQVAPGAATLQNPEPGFFIIGMKSYGRGSAFLMKIGNEQVKHVIELLEK